MSYPYHTYNIWLHIQWGGFLRPKERNLPPHLYHRTYLHGMSTLCIFKDYLLCLNIISHSALFIHSSFQISAPAYTYMQKHTKENLQEINYPSYANSIAQSTSGKIKRNTSWKSQVLFNQKLKKKISQTIKKEQDHEYVKQIVSKIV